MEIPLKNYLESLAKAKNPIDPGLLQHIPFFEEIFERDLWPTLVRLSGDQGIAFMEQKTIPPGELIIKKGSFDMMVYWLLKGRADVIAMLDGKPTIVGKYAEQGECLGELAVIDERERTADVVASKDSGATLLEIDWSITNVCGELETKFAGLMMKTITRKLIDSYDINVKILSVLKKVKAKSQRQEDEIEAFKAIIEKHGPPLV